MKYIIKISMLMLLITTMSSRSAGQVKLEDIPFNLDEILGKTKL